MALVGGTGAPARSRRAPTGPAAGTSRTGCPVDGSIAVITPQRHAAAVLPLDGTHDGRVIVIDPLSTKGLEWDATLVVDPDAIVREAPGGARVLYVVLTRAAHRMTVLRPLD